MQPIHEIEIKGGGEERKKRKRKRTNERTWRTIPGQAVAPEWIQIIWGYMIW